MDVKKIIEFMHVAEKLKCNTRHSWTSSGRQESVAEHSWRLSLMAYFIKDEFPEADTARIILMSLFHDIGEAITGDIPSFYKREKDEAVEENAVTELLETLPESYRKELEELFAEMKAMKTLEAKIYRGLDKLEAVLQHNEADLSTWLPLEYDLNLTYGAEYVAFSDYLKQLRKAMNEETIQKIKDSLSKADI